MAKKSKLGTCCICGKSGVKVTADHVPPKTIFLKPRPENTITVKACNRCNNGASAHDQNFSVYLSMHAVTSHESAEILFRTRTLDTLNRNKKLKKHILSTSETVQLTTESGIIYGTAEAILWDSVSYDAVIERTLRGLYYHHYKEVLGDKAEIKIHMYRKLTKEMMDLYANFNHNEIGHKGELIYKHLRAEESPMHSAWIFQFYNSLFAGGFTSPIP